jgi:hypothetical protein
MYKFLLLLFTLVSSICSFAQEPTASWEKGYYYNLKGNRFPGFINTYDSKNRTFAERYFFFRVNEDDNEKKVYADSVKAYVTGPDSFVVSHVFGLKRTPFVRVIIDDSVKLYESKQMVGSGTPIGGMRANKFMSVGITIPGAPHQATMYCYGSNPDDLSPLGSKPFFEEMSKIFASTPALLEEIKYQEYTYKNMDDIISHYFWYKRHESKKK